MDADQRKSSRHFIDFLEESVEEDSRILPNRVSSFTVINIVILFVQGLEEIVGNLDFKLFQCEAFMVFDICWNVVTLGL